MRDQSALVQAVGKIYGTLLDENPEQAWLDGVREWMGAEHACLNEVGPAMRWWSCSRFSVAERALGDRFVQDPVYSLALEQAPLMSPVRLSRFVPTDALRRTDMYQELIRPMNGGVAAICTWKQGVRLNALTICRSAEKDDDFSDDEMAALRPLLGHLRNAMRVRARMRGLEVALSHANAALDAVPDGVLVLDACGLVRHANVAARLILDDGDGLRLERGAVRAGRIEDDRALQTLLSDTLALRAALHGSRGAGDAALLQGTGNAVLVARSGARRPLLVAVAPSAEASRLLDGDASEAAVLLVRDPERVGACRIEGLMTLFGLTRREAELAQVLYAGDALPVAASRLGVTEGTARQYLKAVFAKTGTHRQAELVALLQQTVG